MIQRVGLLVPVLPSSFALDATSPDSPTPAPTPSKRDRAGARALHELSVRGVVHARAVKSSGRRFASLAPPLRIDGPRMHHTS